MKKSYAEPWKHIATSWKIVTPPWRPSKKNLSHYEQLLKEQIRDKKFPKVLVLGATPEIRDMLAKYKKIEVVIADYNIEMILAMNDLLQRPNFNNETWLKSNWLNMPLKEDYFDVIFGDYVLSQIPADCINIFLEKIANLLRTNGKFLSRIMFYNHTKVKTFDDIIRKFKKMKLTPQSVTDCASELFRSIVIKKQGGYIFSLPNIKKICGAYKEKNENHKLFSELDKLLLPYKKTWFYYDLKSTEKILNDYFIIKNKIKEPFESSLANNTFLYCLQPKNSK